MVMPTTPWGVAIYKREGPIRGGIDSGGREVDWISKVRGTARMLKGRATA